MAGGRGEPARFMAEREPPTIVIGLDLTCSASTGVGAVHPSRAHPRPARGGSPRRPRRPRLGPVQGGRDRGVFNTPLFVGFPGFVSKLWLANDDHGFYRGLYEWDGPLLAEVYPRALWRVLALVSVPGSIHYTVLPQLRRDDLLAQPHLAGAAPVDVADWRRLVEVDDASAGCSGGRRRALPVWRWPCRRPSMGAECGSSSGDPRRLGHPGHLSCTRGPWRCSVRSASSTRCWPGPIFPRELVAVYTSRDRAVPEPPEAAVGSPFQHQRWEKEPVRCRSV
jgi:hypothetical protein